MGLLWTALKWQIPILGKMFGDNRLLLKFTKDNRVEIKTYRMPKERAIYWKSMTGEQKTEISRNWHFLPDGKPVDVVVEGKGESINLVQHAGDTREDSDTGALCQSYYQLGEMVERRKHKTSKKDILMMLLCIVGLGAGIMSLANWYLFQTQTLPNFQEQIGKTIQDSTAEGVKTGVLDLNIPGGPGSGIVMPTGGN